MSNWKVDADDIRLATDFEDDLLYRTDWIENFLSRERESQFFVVATKGFGKTFLLKAKRMQFQDFRGYQCIPEGELLDKPIGATNYNTALCDYFSSNYQNWIVPWQASIILATLKRLNIDISIDNQHLKSLFSPEIKAVSDHFTNIMGLPRKALFALSEVNRQQLIPKVRDVSSPVAIFIDNIDEYFKTHITRNNLRRSDAGELSPDIWYYSQIGLVDAVYQLQRISHHIKVFCSIRKEAYLRIRQFSDMFQQYEGSSVDVRYSKSDLYKIFVKNIQKEPETHLVFPEQLRLNPLVAFLGIEKIEHSLSGEKEDVFDYIHRHTLQRPRDLMSIGARISALPKEERTEDALKEQINKTASKICYTYVNEVLPYLSIQNLSDFDRLLSLINTNVLTKEKLHNICRLYNNSRCQNTDCKQCECVHVFCDLYKAGFLGYKKKDLTLNRFMQDFILPGERTFDSHGVLPESTHYFIHPVLFEIIESLNTEFQNNISRVIVGYGRPCKDDGNDGISRADRSDAKPSVARSVTYVACHPDDEVLSSGALLNHMVTLGCQLTIIWLSAGEHSSSINASTRRDEAVCVCRRLGASPIFANEEYPDLRDGAMSIDKIMAAIEQKIRELSPDIVIWPFGSDQKSQHQDHIALHNTMGKIMTRSSIPTICWLSSQPPVEDDRQFSPTIFFPYNEDDLQRKLDLFKEYKSEAGKPFAQKENILDLARFWRKSGKFDQPYVEAYYIERGVPFEGLFPKS